MVHIVYTEVQYKKWVFRQYHMINTVSFTLKVILKVIYIKNVFMIL